MDGGEVAQGSEETREAGGRAPPSAREVRAELLAERRRTIARVGWGARILGGVEIASVATLLWHAILPSRVGWLTTDQIGGLTVLTIVLGLTWFGMMALHEHLAERVDT